MVAIERDNAFEMAVAAVRYGAGVTRELGIDLADRSLRRALIITDPVIAKLSPARAVVDSLDANDVQWVMYDRVRVEPTEESWLDAIDFARGHTFDAIVAVGGGSSIDTAKAVNLYTSHPPADFLDYVNKPIGKGLPVPGPVKPLFAIPTTAGTGSETTGVAIFDLTRLHVKTGISSRSLKPTLGFLDPDHTRSAPPAVAASCGLDILCHAVESYTAIPFTDRPRPDRPSADHHTRARIRSATSGPCRRCAWWRVTSCERSRIQTTMKQERAWCSPRHLPESDSATRACICRTRWRIQLLAE